MTVYNDKNDEVLVELTLLGDEKAFEELVVRHEKSVKGTAYKVTGNEYSAEDASQDAFVSAWIKLDALREREKFGSWVCSIAKNCARDLVIHYRNAAADISLNLLENTEIAGTDDSELSDILALEKLGEKERDEKLHALIDELSEKIRETVILHYFEGLSLAEISRKLCVPEGTIKWRLAEGRKKLRKEYGVMDKRYNENETLVQRVMRQVEALKLWALKNDKTGFEEEYRAVLKSVEELEESKEKNHALADVLMHGYWWLPGEKNDETFERIKQAAQKSHNEDVMQSVVYHEHNKYRGKEKIDYMLSAQIPKLEKDGFIKALAYVWFWLGREYIEDSQLAKGLEAYRKVTEILTEKDVYYALAIAAIKAESRLGKPEITKNDCSMCVTGETIRRIGNKLYFREQPGYSDGWLQGLDHSIFWNMHCCDSLLYDPDMEVGKTITATDGGTLTYAEKGVTVETCAGVFENCSVYVFRGDKFKYRLTYCETYLCPGIGIVRQKVTRYGTTNEWTLANYRINGGDGMLPFAKGNRWEYVTHAYEGLTYELESSFEVTSFDGNTAVLSSLFLSHITGYMEDTCIGNLVKARRNYAVQVSETAEKLVDVSGCMKKALSLAQTEREKKYADVAGKVMSRIFECDPTFNPNYTQKGRWNFFHYYDTITENGRIELIDNRHHSFEWKDMRHCGDEGYKVLYNFMWELMQDTMNCVWSDEWIPGYRFKGKRMEFRDEVTLEFEVTEDEAVTVKSGAFENCRHIIFSISGKTAGFAYRGGRTEFWYAEGIGVVKMLKYFHNNTKSCIWELTEYCGTGSGYFPLSDGLFRKYEPCELGNGWHGSVEFSYTANEDGCIIFANQLGTQDRENYEADTARAKAEEEVKKK